MKNIAHFVVMRFGVGIYDEKWLEHRLSLLRATMIPSLLAQKGAPFFFSILCDRDHPQRYKELLHSAISKLPDATVIPIEFHGHRRVEHKIYLQEMCAKHGFTHFISTRVDDDDALTSGALQAIQRHAARAVDDAVLPAAIVVSSGIRYVASENVAVWQNHKSNAIGLSIVSSAKDPGRNIFSVNHTAITEDFPEKGWPVLRIERDEAAWMYTLHKYSDTKFEVKKDKVISSPNKFSPSDRDIGMFGVDIPALNRWLELERKAVPITGDKITERLGTIEKEVSRLRRAARPDKARIAQLLAERRSVGARIVS